LVVHGAVPLVLAAGMLDELQHGQRPRPDDDHGTVWWIPVPDVRLDADEFASLRHLNTATVAVAELA